MTKAEITELYKLMFTEYPDIVTVKQLQTILGVSRNTAYVLIDEGTLPAIKVGKAYRIPKISVIKYVLSMNDDLKKK
jgi:excisionase family DNA binding protein